ncbi:ABC transporter ATP-binding protein [Bacillus sp. JJ1533]|uniref:ABC transporter ATP-binding protein n=1 Tax=Bacillus sp. JJ1533 TaxID=3122959 RepID=UPI002FFDE575
MLLRVKGLKVAYKGIEVVHGVDFTVKEGEITVLIGSNGAGKSSIIKAIMGLISKQQGELLFLDNNLSSLSPNKMAALGISLCPEGRQLFPEMTVTENLEMGAFARKDKKEIKKDIERMFDRFPRLGERANQRAGTLSGGEQEMVAIARALMARPKLLILDEPSWGLAPLMVEEVMKIIKEINSEGTTILLIEQNASMALAIADNAYVLDVGKIVIEGTGKDLIENEKVKQVYLGV